MDETNDNPIAALGALFGGASGEETTNSGATAPIEDLLANDTPADPAHQVAFGGVLQQAADSQGIGLGTLVQQLGLSSEDVTALTQGDLLKAALHLAQQHPELLAQLASHIPGGGQLLGLLGGVAGNPNGDNNDNAGGGLGGLLGGLLGGR